MKVLVTGATGFVGSGLCHQLKALGHEVRVFVRRGSVDKIDPRGGFEIAQGDILDSHACLRAVQGVDAVVHLVGIRAEEPQTGTTYEAMHTEATYDIVDAARRARVSRFIYLSGLGTREDARSRYHVTKWESEQIVRRSDMRWTIFRPSVIFGEGDEFHQILSDLVHRSVVPIVDGGTSLLQPVSRDNVVAAVAAALTMPETQGQIYEVGGAVRVTFADVIERIARHYEVWPNYWRVSSRLMKPMVKMLQRFKGFPLSYDELLMMLEDNVCDSSLFVDTFGVTLDAYPENVDSLLSKVELKIA